MKDELLDEVEAIKLSIETYNAQRESYSRWELQYDWVADVVHVGGCTVIPEMVPSLRLTVEDVNILPLWQPDKEPGAESQQEEPDKTTIPLFQIHSTYPHTF